MCSFFSFNFRLPFVFCLRAAPALKHPKPRLSIPEGNQFNPIYFRAIHNIGPQRATLMLAMVPGISAVAAVPLLKESLDAVTLAGVVLVTIGAVLGATHQQSEDKGRTISASGLAAKGKTS